MKEKIKRFKENVDRWEEFATDTTGLFEIYVNLAGKHEGKYYDIYFMRTHEGIEKIEEYRGSLKELWE